MTPRAARPADGVAWVTGASSGLGREVALQLARGGFRVAVSARNSAELEALAAEARAAGLTIQPFPLDVTDAAATASTVAAIEAGCGPIALAILNAGVYLPTTGDALDLSAFHTTFRVNLEGSANALVPLIETMKARGRGQIAIVSSVTGYAGLPTSAAYGASKAGLINMAESLKFDTDKLGIKLQVVNPGFIDTPLTRKNAFAMPALMPVEQAAARLIAGLTARGFEISFPRRFTWVLKLVGLLPYSLYFRVVAAATGWNRRG